MLTDDLALAWLTELEAAGSAPNTLRRYRTVLTGLANPGVASREEVEAWWQSRGDRKPATRRGDLGVLRAFYRWCAIADHRLDDPTVRLDPADHLEPPRTTSSSGSAASRRVDVEELLAAVRDQPELVRAVWLSHRAKLWIGAVAALMWDDVDEQASQLRVAGRDGRPRLVDVDAALLAGIGPRPRRWRAVNVLTGTMTVLSPDAARQRVNRGLRRAGSRVTTRDLCRAVTGGLEAS